MMMPSHDSATGRSAQAGRPCRVQFAQAAEVFDVERLAFSDLRGDTRDVTGTGNDPDWWSMGAARSRRLAEFADTFWLRKGFCIWSFATAEAVCMRWGEEQEEVGRPGADAHPAAGAAQTDEAVCANVGEGREPSGVGAITAPSSSTSLATPCTGRAGAPAASGRAFNGCCAAVLFARSIRHLVLALSRSHTRARHRSLLALMRCDEMSTVCAGPLLGCRRGLLTLEFLFRVRSMFSRVTARPDADGREQ